MLPEPAMRSSIDDSLARSGLVPLFWLLHRSGRWWWMARWLMLPDASPFINHNAHAMRRKILFQQILIFHQKYCRATFFRLPASQNLFAIEVKRRKGKIVQSISLFHINVTGLAHLRTTHVVRRADENRRNIGATKKH